MPSTCCVVAVVANHLSDAVVVDLLVGLLDVEALAVK